MVAGERRRPAASSTAGTVMGASSQSHNGSSPLPYQRSHIPPTASPPRSCSRFAMALRTPAARQPDTRPSSGASVPDLTTETLAPARKQHSLKRVAAGAAARLLGGVSPERNVGALEEIRPARAVGD